MELSKTKEYLDIIAPLLEEHLPNEDEKAKLEKKLKEKNTRYQKVYLTY
ncbi:hypothetical protein ACT7DH_10625 [Bacillus pacificus]